jgi:hypothetical protein
MLILLESNSEIIELTEAGFDFSSAGVFSCCKDYSGRCRYVFERPVGSGTMTFKGSNISVRYRVREFCKEDMGKSVPIKFKDSVN